MTKEKKRLDLLLVEKGFFPSREKARAAIMAGQVLVDGQKVSKPGAAVAAESKLEVLVTLPYVSRGGLKLARALEFFHINVTGCTALDVGASTGGFTDCLIQAGAARVYAVDVGYGQLAWSLRNDPRVVVLERTNIRYLNPEQLFPPPDFVTVDVSFISLTKVLPVLASLLAPGAAGVLLVKPQFEAGRQQVGKKGVVRDPLVHEAVLHQIWEEVNRLGWGVLGLTYSPVRGPEGNIEYLLYFATDRPDALAAQNIQQVVREAHACL
ncbi:MAG: TlyA family RNA methyltransferase [Desulfurispora sp.]|uniref:TlyA family RNA methyltransferase n=1 Tax=Desulfurispora sp. TaxID=3014275 RepID=UPI00404AED24